MIEVRARLGADGVLRRVDSSGHAGTDAGRPGPGLRRGFRPAADRLRGPGRRFPAHGSRDRPPSRGSFGSPCGDCQPRGRGSIEGIGDFLLTGLSGLEREYPGASKLTTERYWRE
ncbi:MAG: hypothetical protein M0C28_21915 [Candidatus Moduliflexus flocculans]|nr:hypothetical protein [Candidatus Moduliflexus flocculans]